MTTTQTTTETSTNPASNQSSTTISSPPVQHGFLSDHTGKNSMMRLMSFLSMLTSIGFGYMTLKLSSDQGIYITTTFLLAAFAPKALQKFVENAYPAK